MATEFGAAANEIIGGGVLGCGAASETAATIDSNPVSMNTRGAPRIRRDFTRVLPVLRVSQPDFAQTICRRPSQLSEVVFGSMLLVRKLRARELVVASAIF